MKLHAPHVERRRFRFASPELHTTVVRGRDFRAVCSCGYESPSLQTYAEAARAGRIHRLEHV